MASKRLRELLRDPVRRTYLDTDYAWWADTILTECHFLEELGYVIEAINFHHNGAWFRYRGPHGSVAFHFDPETDFIGAEASLSGGLISFEGDLDVLARIHDPSTVAPPKYPLTRTVITDCVRYWANALGAAPEILPGPGRYERIVRGYEAAAARLATPPRPWTPFWVALVAAGSALALVLLFFWAPRPVGLSAFLVLTVFVGLAMVWLRTLFAVMDRVHAHLLARPHIDDRLRLLRFLGALASYCIVTIVALGGLIVISR